MSAPNSHVTVGNVVFGNAAPLALIAGPCQLESRQHAFDMAGALKLSETKSFEAIQGKAGTREVVDAVMNAEQSLQTAIAIRDKVVTAYLEVARMQI